MNIFKQIETDYNAFLARTFTLDADTIARTSLTVNSDEQKAEFGDLNSNAAMILAKTLKQSPASVAEIIVGQFTHPHVEQLRLHMPGFVNFYLKAAAFQELTKELFEQKAAFFRLYPTPTKNINIEFVSANPTGPLHLGHGRGAIIGDVLARVLNFAGQKATKEFYINNAGAQMQKLANSLKIRVQQALGTDVQLPEDAYHGEYLIELAQKLIAEKGPQVVEQDSSFFAAYGEEHLLAAIKDTLAQYGITFDVWFPETKLHSSGEIVKALDRLNANGYLYEKDDATWFKATAFGDDKDRVLIKDDGEYTYASADVAYMLDKVDRGFDNLIMILGHDHHSYLMRLQCIRQALGIDASLDIILYQLVKMKQSGQQVRMSKRAGNIVTLKDVIETVGTDVARFFFLNRKADAQLEFDLDLALAKTEENPVYYVQYAYVRTKSIIQKAQETIGYTGAKAEDARAIGDAEHLLLKKIVSLRSILETICTTHQTHLLTYYILELAHIFHSYYGKNRVVDEQNHEQSKGRLLVIQVLQDTFKTVLTLLGISCPERM
jgi:arginyl-tRNA synthetase